ncbi:hypothetical protein GCM10010517_22520 [Streptosporangium fragile]|uniref:DUF3618 domain-containing protein n=1 Tax=Streptosporangium fragile TaxID=46186 RepID=A0ABN3VUB4_9ACTN
MTETDPGRPDSTPTAGTTGAHRKAVGEPVTPDERESLNIPPNQPIGTPVETAEELGVPPSERDGTPRLPGGAAGAAGAPAEVSGAAAPYADTGDSAVGTTTGAAGREDDKESVRRDIEEARRELGDTVEALVHKTDVKGRVQETAAHVGDDLRRMRTATATTATEVMERVKGAAPEVVGRMRGAAPEVVGRVKERTPVELRDAAQKVTTEAGKRPAVTTALVAALVLILFRLLRRGKRK